jgi:hypothetical protein
MAMYVFPGGFQLARGVGGSTFATAAPFESILTGPPCLGWRADL